MKRWVISGAITLLVGYSIAYRFLPWRDAGRFRNAELFVHTREFRYEWEGRLFSPAAYMEWRMFPPHPQPWLPHPSWSTYPQVLLLEAGDRRWTFPLNAFRNRSNQSMKPTAPFRKAFSVFATTPCRGLSLSR